MKNIYLKMDGMSLLTGECHWVESRDTTIKSRHADIAQLVEQLICNQQVGGSSPSIGSDACRNNQQVEGSSTGTPSYESLRWLNGIEG